MRSSQTAAEQSTPRTLRTPQPHPAPCIPAPAPSRLSISLSLFFSFSWRRRGQTGGRSASRRDRPPGPEGAPGELRLRECARAPSPGLRASTAGWRPSSPHLRLPSPPKVLEIETDAGEKKKVKSNTQNQNRVSLAWGVREATYRLSTASISLLQSFPRPSEDVPSLLVPKANRTEVSPPWMLPQDGLFAVIPAPVPSQSGTQAPRRFALILPLTVGPRETRRAEANLLTLLGGKEKRKEKKRKSTKSETCLKKTSP